jgi:hypothetical protein
MLQFYIGKKSYLPKSRIIWGRSFRVARYDVHTACFGSPLGEYKAAGSGSGPRRQKDPASIDPPVSAVAGHIAHADGAAGGVAPESDILMLLQHLEHTCDIIGQPL